MGLVHGPVVRRTVSHLSTSQSDWMAAENALIHVQANEWSLHNSLGLAVGGDWIFR
jgi:hypothetical protein